VSPEPSLAARIAARLSARREAHRRRSRVYRVLFVVAGVAVTLAGLAMLVLPGPALVVIPIGLAMLSLEFAWADRALRVALRRAEKAERTAKAATPAQKALTGVAVVLAVAAAGAAAILWDIPLLPV